MKHITLVAAMAFSMGAVAQITDGGFEAGIGAGTWNEASVNYGTPLCDATCGTCGGPCSPRTGAIYAWFGGAGDASEIGSVDQDAHIPEGSTANLLIYAKIALPGDGTDGNYLKVLIDGTEVAMITAEDEATYADYTLWSIPIDAYADGATHNVRLEGKEAGNGETFNMLADDISLQVDGEEVAGLFENEALAGVQVYPNPANTAINVNFNAMKGAATVSIVDVNGQMVSSERFSEISRRVLQFNSLGLANGLYTVTIEQNGQRLTHRVVVAH